MVLSSVGGDAGEAEDGGGSGGRRQGWAGEDGGKQFFFLSLFFWTCEWIRTADGAASFPK